MERGGACFSPRPRQRACQVPLTRQGGGALIREATCWPHKIKCPMKTHLSSNSYFFLSISRNSKHQLRGAFIWGFRVIYNYFSNSILSL